MYRWDADERQDLMAQLDAAYFHFYGIDRDSAGYILSTFSNITESGKSIFEPESITEKILRYYDQYRVPVIASEAKQSQSDGLH